jgi:hypothetical protein
VAFTQETSEQTQTILVIRTFEEGRFTDQRIEIFRDRHVLGAAWAYDPKHSEVLWMCGGTIDRGGCFEALADCYCIDLCTESVHSVKPLPRPIYDATATISDNTLYLCGGMETRKYKRLSSTFFSLALDSSEASWKELALEFDLSSAIKLKNLTPMGKEFLVCLHEVSKSQFVLFSRETAEGKTLLSTPGVHSFFFKSSETSGLIFDCAYKEILKFDFETPPKLFIGLPDHASQASCCFFIGSVWSRTGFTKSFPAL